MKNEKKDRPNLVFPLPASMFVKAKLELEEDYKKEFEFETQLDNISTMSFVNRSINGLLYSDFWQLIKTRAVE